MPKITALESIKRQKAWYEIRFDNGVSFAVNDELILKHLLKPGQTFNSDEIKGIRERAEYHYLKKKALEILARKRITEKEIRRKLRAVKSCAHHTDRLITELKGHGYIDDYSYAVNFIHYSLAGNPHSKRYISQKLYQKGVPSDIANKAMANELSDYDEYEAALKLSEKKSKTVKNLPELKAKKRISDFLRGRGFNWDVINSVLAELFERKD
ncbi:MAG: regulatory protein RecX [candidate division Zixibacteria bacterium]|nr:regulatory protein RecX [candidate division Zixibacteria bacterium]